MSESGPLREGTDYYFNDQGLMVFTEAYHLKRGYCCGSGCRHCPFRMERIPPRERFTRHAKSRATPPELLRNAIARFGLEPESCAVSPLSGGYMNANFLVQGNERNFVFRIYSRDQLTAGRERDVLRLLRESGIPVPDSLDLFELDRVPVAILEHIDGITLEDRLLSGEPLDSGIYEDIGKNIARVHRITFRKAGFIGPKITPGDEYESFGAFLGQFIDRTLTWLESRQDRLDLDTNRRLRRLLDDKWELVLATEPARELTHCDFNPKNILVSKGARPEMLAIIDWEFSLVGNGLIDLGNFFRFSYDYPPDARARFEAGYRAIRPSLPEGWEKAARLLDIGNMCSFLERKEAYPESFRTARYVIRSTLEELGY